MEEASETLFWKVAFYIALALAGVFALICGFLLGGRYYKDEARQNSERFVLVLKHQAELWKQEREKREKEYELRLEEQRRKNAAWEQNSDLRDDLDDVMEENRLLGEQKDELIHRSERLELETQRLRMANAGLAVQIAQARRPGQMAEPQFEPESEPEPEPEPVMVVEPETVVESEIERPRSNVRFSSTLIGSGLPPGSTWSLEDAVKRGLDSPQSQTSSRSFPSTWTDSEPGTPSRIALPPSPLDNDHHPDTSKPMGSMMTVGGLLPGPEQRKTWAGQPGEPGASNEEDDPWKPMSLQRK